MSDCWSVHTNSWTHDNLNGQKHLEANSKKNPTGVVCTLAVGYGVLNILHVHTEILWDAAKREKDIRMYYTTWRLCFKTYWTTYKYAGNVVMKRETLFADPKSQKWNQMLSNIINTFSPNMCMLCFMFHNIRLRVSHALHTMKAICIYKNIYWNDILPICQCSRWVTREI